MPEQPLFLAAAAAWLPPPAELTALAGGGADEFVTNGIVSVPVAGPDDAPPEMAARAAQTALARAAGRRFAGYGRQSARRAKMLAKPVSRSGP